MDVWSVGGDTVAHASDREQPSMKEIFNRLSNIHHEENRPFLETDTIDLLPENDGLGEEDMANELIPPVAVYRRRWYILAVFAFFTAIQGEVSNTWSPIENSAQYIFGWSDRVVAIICNLALISYVVSIPISTWLMDSKGLRISSLAAALCLTLGTGIRCITMATPLSTWLVMTGQVLIGFSGPVSIAGAPLLAATWFPANQRTLSTAIGVITNSIGVSISFIVGPLLVPKLSRYDDLSAENKYNQVKADITNYMYFSFAGSALSFFLLLVYFPSKPPTPPSVSSTLTRTNYKDGLKKIARNWNFWILTLAYSIPNGVANGWVSVVDIILADIGISQKTAGWIAFTGAMASCGAALILGYLSDKFRGKIKLTLIILYTIGSLSTILYIFIYYGYIKSEPILYISVVVIAIGVLSTTPLFFSMAAEVTFPIGEAVTNGAFTLLYKLVSIAFLFALSVPGVGTAWMNWCFFGSIVVAVPILVVFKENYNRLHAEVPLSE